jgi:hypothetical protein
MRNASNILVRKPEGKRPLGRPRHSGKMILEWILGKQGGNEWTGCIWFRTWTSGRLL